MWCAYKHQNNMDYKRKLNWQEEEALLFAELVEHVIKGKFSPKLTSADKKKA